MLNSFTTNVLEKLCGQTIHWVFSLDGSNSWSPLFVPANKVRVTKAHNTHSYLCLPYHMLHLFATFFSPECDNYFKKSLFLVGEIGGNDYNYAYFAGGSIKQLRASVPLVVEAIAKATSVSYIALITSRLIKKNTYKKKKREKT